MNRAEECVLAYLTDTDGIEVLVDEGLETKYLPTEDLHRIVEWAFKQYYDSSRTQAPSLAALEQEWGSYISDKGIEWPEEGFEYDTPQWAVSMLKANWVMGRMSRFQMEMAQAMAEADPGDRVLVVQKGADDLGLMAMSLATKRISVEFRDGVQDALRRYEKRAESDDVEGLHFGLKQIDDHVTGVHPGELAVVAAGPKTGKSFFTLCISRNELRAGRNVCLATLEMSVSETYDRLACFELGLDHSLFLRGDLPIEDVKRLREYVNDVLLDDSLGRLHIIKPEPGQRTPEAILRMARVREAQTLVVDQLTFMEHPSEGKKKRDEVIRDKMHDLKNGLSVGRDEIACVLAHQINREGMKQAAKSGFLSMEYLADGAEVERTADMVFGLYRSQVEREAQMMKFMTLAGRRFEPKHWYLAWRIARGHISVLREMEMSDE